MIATDRSGSDESGTTSPEAVAGTVSGIGQHRREASPFDVVVEGVTSGADKRSDREILQSLADAGATWWIESRWGADQFAATLHDRIRRGPPTFG
ncbi:MAG TPA: hypothetical protein VK845_16265 [Gemmatimonadales bacterium]|nr:hypothetical protein [Gemmatimonadales bacterium]